MHCSFCHQEVDLEDFIKINACLACGYALDNFSAEPIKCTICNDERSLSRDLYIQIFPERALQIPLEAIYVACDCSLEDEDDEF